MGDREAPCSGPLAKAEEELPAQEVAPDTKHGTETAVRSDTDVGEGGGGGTETVKAAEVDLACLGIVN